MVRNHNSYLHYNARGNVVGHSSAAGTPAITFLASYEAFGRKRAISGTTQDRQAANTKEQDPTRLLNDGFRYRDLETGSYITRDPAGFVDGPNLYTYVRQNPWSKFDPHGLKDQEWHHYFLQENEKYFEEAGIKIHKSIHGIFLSRTDHTGKDSGIHPKWNKDCERFIKENPIPSARGMRKKIFKQLQDMKGMDEYKAQLQRGAKISTKLDYNQYSNLDSAGRYRIIQRSYERQAQRLRSEYKHRQSRGAATSGVLLLIAMAAAEASGENSETQKRLQENLSNRRKTGGGDDVLATEIAVDIKAMTGIHDLGTLAIQNAYRAPHSIQAPDYREDAEAPLDVTTIPCSDFRP